MKYCKRIFALLLSVSMVFSMLMANSAAALAVDSYSVDFGNGSWTVGEVTVTANKTGVQTISYTDEIELEKFDAGTMEVRVFAADGFNTTLNVEGGKTGLSKRTNEGGLPDTLTFGVQQKGQQGPGGPQMFRGEGAVEVNCMAHGEAIKNGQVVYMDAQGQPQDPVPESWTDEGTFGLRLVLEEGYFVEPSSIQLSFEYDDPREGDPIDRPSRSGQRIQLSKEQRQAVAAGLVGEQGYVFDYTSAEYIGQGKDNVRIRLQLSVSQAFEETVNLHFYKQDREDPENWRQVEAPASAEDMFLEDFCFNGNAVAMENGLAAMGGYVTGGEQNELAFMPGFGTKIEAVYYAAGNVAKDALDPDGMTELTPIKEQLPTEEPGVFVDLERYLVQLPAGSDYTVLVQYGLSDELSLRWSYLKQYEDEDFYVENGKVYVDKIVRTVNETATTIYDNTDPRNPIDLEHIVDVKEDQGGEIFALRGDEITLRLVPDAGYQLASASLNGSELEAQEAISTFTVVMERNLHFAGTFAAMDDIASIDESAEAIVLGAELKEGAAAYDKIDTGTLCLSIAANSDMQKTDDALAVIDDTHKEVIASLDMELSNVVFKGDAQAEDPFWTVEDAADGLKELTDPVVAELNLGKVELAEGETVTVVREHQNGADTELEELETYHWYNEEGELIAAVATDKFSTYTFIKKPVELESSLDTEEDDLKQLLIAQGGIGEITASDLENAQDEEIEYILSVKDAASTMDAAVKQQLAEAAPDHTVGLYLDLGIKVRVAVGGTIKEAALSELPEKLTITVLLPEELRNTNAAMKRIFSVVRKHGGEVELLDAQYDEMANSITFQTDKFSDYAVVYRDVPVLVPAVDNGDSIVCQRCGHQTWAEYLGGFQCVNCGNLRMPICKDCYGTDWTVKNGVVVCAHCGLAQGQQPNGKRISPQTGDNSNAALLTLVVLLSMSTLAGVEVLRRRKVR